MERAIATGVTTDNSLNLRGSSIDPDIIAIRQALRLAVLHATGRHTTLQEAKEVALAVLERGPSHPGQAPVVEKLGDALSLAEKRGYKSEVERRVFLAEMIRNMPERSLISPEQ